MFMFLQILTHELAMIMILGQVSLESTAMENEVQMDKRALGMCSEHQLRATNAYFAGFFARQLSPYKIEKLASSRSGTGKDS